MYITLPSPQRNELWVPDIDGGNKVKIATGEGLGTGTWAPDNFQLLFFETEVGGASTAYIVGADGSGLRQLPPMAGAPIGAVWSPDQKSVYVSIAGKAQPALNIWKWEVKNSNAEKFVDDCGQGFDIDDAGQHLLGAITNGERTGIYEASTSERKCILLLPGVATDTAFFAGDGKLFLYAIASHSQVTIYRQPWRDGKTIGAPQVALRVPFAFPLDYAGGNASDFSRDLSTIVYARPGDHADIYLLSQKKILVPRKFPMDEPHAARPSIHFPDGPGRSCSPLERGIYELLMTL
jgi:hypothetical protein